MNRGRLPLRAGRVDWHGIIERSHPAFQCVELGCCQVPLAQRLATCGVIVSGRGWGQAAELLERAG